MASTSARERVLVITIKKNMFGEMVSDAFLDDEVEQ